MEYLTSGARPQADRAFKVLQPLDVGFGFGPELVRASMLQSRPVSGASHRSAVSKQPQSGALPEDSKKATSSKKVSDSSGNLRWETPSIRSKNINSEDSVLKSAVTAKAAGRQNGPGGTFANGEAHVVDFDRAASFVASLNTPQLGPELLGESPSRWSVLLAVCVDASLCFALLAASQMAVLIGGWQELLARILAEPSLAAQLQHLSVLLEGPLGQVGFKVPNPEGLLQLVLVLGGWIALVWAVQLFCVSAWRSTLGRTLAGIRVNPISSRSSGRIGMPLFEVLTFGGLFTLPIALLRPDKHVFLSKIRYHT